MLLKGSSKMDTEVLNTSHKPNIGQWLSPSVVPVLLIAIGYVDPGKWAAMVEAGGRFGSDFVLLMLVFNFTSILCQYLSAHIALITGRDLSQICSREYDKATCMFLGVLTELSMFALDLTMILGTAQAFNLVFGADLCTSVFLTAIDAVLCPLFSNLLDNGKVKFLCVSMASFILPFYIIGVLFSQPEISMSMNGMLEKIIGESAFGLMSLLGANIMPHNFYFHSSIVQQELGASNVSKGLLPSHDHLFAILCIFSGIFLVNYVLMNSAANMFYSSGLLLLTFQDALSLMDQIFRSSTVLFALLLVLLVSSQITALTRNNVRQKVLNDFFGMDIPGWLHHATIRIVATLTALYWVLHSGAEGIFQLLVFTQVVVALAVPPSVIPLFRVASSRSVMGVHKISQLVEFVAVVICFGMLGLEIIFLVEMIFGNSDWVSSLRSNPWSSMSLYIFLLITASTSLCLMLWLAATPLKSASSRSDSQLLNWDIKDPEPGLFPDGCKIDFRENWNHSMVVSMKNQEPAEVTPEKSLENYSQMSTNSTDLNFPAALLDCNSISNSPTIENSGSSIPRPNPVFDAMFFCEDSFDLKKESTGFVEKTVKVEENLRTWNDEGENPETEESSKGVMETEESSKGVMETIPSLISECPGSCRSITGKSDDSGSGARVLSRLSGLGRTARRQYAAVLDEFWGQLFDFHGQATKEAKAKKLDLILKADSEVGDPKPAPLKVDTSVKEFIGFSSSPHSSSLFDSPKLLGSMGASYGVKMGSSSSSWSRRMRLLDAYVQNTSHISLDSSERRYSSLQLPPSSVGKDYQPATVHGYQIASYVSRITKERKHGYLDGQVEAVTPKSPTLGISSYIDPPGFTRARKLQNRVVSGNIALPSEGLLNDCSPAESLNSTVNEKKYYSLPDISRFSLHHNNSYLSDRRRDRDSRIGYGPSLYTSNSMKAGAPLAFDDLSSSKPYRDPFTVQLTSSLETGSLWSRQPCEQRSIYRTVDKTPNIGGEGVGCKKSSLSPGTLTVVDLEAKLLESFRHCIVKLLKLEGSDWLFRQNDGADEDLIDLVAARERFVYEAEKNRAVNMCGSLYASEKKLGSVMNSDETDYTEFLVSSVAHCGEGCVWRADLITSFGVWCIRRVLELSLMESRPELWGKYTYVLNRLQGIIDFAFSKRRTPMTPCFCLQIPVANHQTSIPPPISNGTLPQLTKQGRVKCTTAAMLLDMIKDVEIIVSSRKGRAGTAAGDVAFPKGKENLASVLKRYKRRLSKK